MTGRVSNQQQYKNNSELLAKLEQQIAKIETFVIDLQQDQKWQRIFYNKKLYLSLNTVFNHHYSEYAQYLEDIIKDYNILKKLANQHKPDLQIFYLNQLQTKVFALFKILRSLRKYHQSQEGYQLNSHQISERQEQAHSLTIKKESLEKMLSYLEIQYNNLNKKFLYKKNNNIEDNMLQNNLLKLLDKKGKLERELFSINERLKLYS